ncbi:transposase [Streptomyces sp. GC420]|uniref:transposase n=1 Tax=Streptomyces sp. GC420 TaxID=2697568 RepID=UPI001414CE05|nr:transposase [Streptomyces sp. GC420]NBM14229.1 transposase [Streptomyces sp. GC420]
MDTLILDLLDPEEARTPPMAMKDYSDEFKADTVALYESTPGATYKSIAADLGINRETLREWVLRDRERRGVAPAAARSGRAAPARAGQLAPSADPDERIRQLEARVAEYYSLRSS